MIKHQLFIQARQRPEVLERILRVVRHRGFRVYSMNVEQVPGDKVRLDLTVVSDRPIHLLTTQLDKLMDVELVELQFETSQLSA